MSATVTTAVLHLALVPLQLPKRNNPIGCCKAQGAKASTVAVTGARIWANNKVVNFANVNKPCMATCCFESCLFEGRIKACLHWLCLLWTLWTITTATATRMFCLGSLGDATKNIIVYINCHNAQGAKTSTVARWCNWRFHSETLPM